MMENIPLSLAEAHIDRFKQQASHDIERLKLHRQTLVQLQRTSRVKESIHEAQNAKLIASRLQTALNQIEQLRGKVRSSDVAGFDRQVEQAKKQALDEIELFTAIDYHLQEQRTQLEEAEQEQEQQVIQSRAPLLEGVPPLLLEQDRLARCRKINTEVQAISQMMGDLSATVHSQSNVVDSIEENISQADADVARGARHLSRAAKLKAATVPLVGAAAGGLIGGPVGLLIGLKAGLAAAAGGGLIGLVGGHFIKKMHRRGVNEDVAELNQRESASTQRRDVPTDSAEKKNQ